MRKLERKLLMEEGEERSVRGLNYDPQPHPLLASGSGLTPAPVLDLAIL